MVTFETLCIITIITIVNYITIPQMGLSGNAIMLLVLYNGGMMMQSSQITVGDLSAFLLYAGYVGISIGGLSNFYTNINKSLGASSRLWELADRRPSIPLNGADEYISKYPGLFEKVFTTFCFTVGLIPDISLPASDIVFENVKFTYPARADYPIFEDLNLTVKSRSITGKLKG